MTTKEQKKVAKADTTTATTTITTRSRRYAKRNTELLPIVGYVVFRKRAGEKRVGGQICVCRWSVEQLPLLCSRKGQSILVGFVFITEEGKVMDFTNFFEDVFNSFVICQTCVGDRSIMKLQFEVEFVWFVGTHGGCW